MKPTNAALRRRSAFLMFALCVSAANSQDVAPFPPAPDDVPSAASMVSQDEPGERLIVTGTVYKSDKRTPYSGLILYFYQTDATGVYNKVDGSWQRPRLHGWVRTDVNGRYEIRTIKPGSYPRRREPAHIHVTGKPASGPPVWLGSLLFEGDPNLQSKDVRESAEAGNFSYIMKITKGKDNVLRGVRNLVVDFQ